MTVRLEDEVRDRLDQLAEATRRSKSFLAAEAIRAFVETNEWQIGEIRAALREADAGDFASEKEVEVCCREGDSHQKKEKSAAEETNFAIASEKSDIACKEKSPPPTHAARRGTSPARRRTTSPELRPREVGQAENDMHRHRQQERKKSTSPSQLEVCHCWDSTSQPIGSLPSPGTQPGTCPQTGRRPTGSLPPGT